MMQTMVNDLKTEMKNRWWKSQDLYKPRVVRGDEGTKFKCDRHGGGPPGPSNILILGVSRRCCEESFTVEAVANILEELLSGDGPLGQWYGTVLGEWINDVHVAHFEELEITLDSYASLSKGSQPWLETISNVSGEIDNSAFSIQLPRMDTDLDSFTKHIDWQAVNDVGKFATWA